MSKPQRSIADDVAEMSDDVLKVRAKVAMALSGVVDDCNPVALSMVLMMFAGALTVGMTMDEETAEGGALIFFRTGRADFGEWKASGNKKGTVN